MSKKLSKLNDDWIKTGMELGLIDHAVIFGVESGKDTANFKPFYKDQQGNIHKIKLLGLPGAELEFQGDLSDMARRESLSELWNILNWQCNSQFSFAQDESGQIGGQVLKYNK